MEILNKLYGTSADLQEKQARIDALRQDFKTEFDRECKNVFSSPGRIEILGNHTDHNHGSVLVGAISMDILAAAAKRPDSKITIKSRGFEDVSLFTGDLEKREGEIGKSAALVRGVCRRMRDRGHAVGGFDALLDSNIFKGAGVSSSAAYEVLICKILSYYYNGDRLTALECAKISQFAESEYFGKPCGLLDQSGIAFGGVNHIDFNDNTNPAVTTLTPDFQQYSAVITNSGGDHSNLTAEYSQIKADMHGVSGFFGKETLREVEETEFYQNISALNKKLGGRPILRAVHFYEENKRVDMAAEALKSGNMETFLHCVNDSGKSSYKLLQNCYACGDARQGIPLALALSNKLLAGEGAVRVHGGGFAGTVIAFVPQHLLKSYTDGMAEVFGADSVAVVSVRNIGTAKIL